MCTCQDEHKDRLWVGNIEMLHYEEVTKASCSKTFNRKDRVKPFDLKVNEPLSSDSKADFLSVSPSSEQFVRCDKGITFETSALRSLQWPINLISQLSDQSMSN